MHNDKLSLETHESADEMLRIGIRAAKRAQEENRKKGIPNVYDINGHLYYELPNGELTKEDPYPLSKEEDR
ncbi:MAG: hypothetical protein OXI67_01195 [Candidatus Poribacteria bacterium]|nr:hypothetical protein [Candidatus Poribacteria bacterium]